MLIPMLCSVALAQEVSPSIDPSVELRGPTKLERLERDRSGLRTAIERRDALPWTADWLLEVDLFFDPRSADWFETSDAYLPKKPLDYELRWSSPAEGRELPFHTDLEAPNHPYACITDFARQLDAHGVELLVVPVPTRLQVYPELILPDPEELELATPFPGLAPGYAEFLLELSDAGIEVVDLLPLLAERRFGLDPQGRSDQAFLKYNMHWTPRSAQAAACAVHERLTELDGYEPGPLRENRDFVLSGQTLPWQPAASRKIPPEVEPEDLFFVRVLSPAGKELVVEDTVSPLLLIGDSYVTHFSLEQASFVEHLFRLTGQRVDLVAQQGSGSLATRGTLARRTQDGVFSKRVVVWMFSVVSLVDAREWRLIELPVPDQD